MYAFSSTDMGIPTRDQARAIAAETHRPTGSSSIQPLESRLENEQLQIQSSCKISSVEFPPPSPSNFHGDHDPIHAVENKETTPSTTSRPRPVTAQIEESTVQPHQQDCSCTLCSGHASSSTLHLPREARPLTLPWRDVGDNDSIHWAYKTLTNSPTRRSTGGTAVLVDAGTGGRGLLAMLGLRDAREGSTPVDNAPHTQSARTGGSSLTVTPSIPATSPTFTDPGSATLYAESESGFDSTTSTTLDESSSDEDEDDEDYDLDSEIEDDGPFRHYHYTVPNQLAGFDSGGNEATPVPLALDSDVGVQELTEGLMGLGLGLGSGDWYEEPGYTSDFEE